MAAHLALKSEFQDADTCIMDFFTQAARRPIPASGPLDERIDALFQHWIALFDASHAYEQIADRIDMHQRSAIGWPMSQTNSQLSRLLMELARELPDPQDEPVLDGDHYVVWTVEHDDRGAAHCRFGPYSVPLFTERQESGAQARHAQISKVLAMFHRVDRRRSPLTERYNLPHEFGSLNGYTDHSGFTTLADLHRWFYGVIPSFERAGYEIACYRVPIEHCQVNGPGLLVFDRSRTELVSRHDMHGRELAIA